MVSGRKQVCLPSDSNVGKFLVCFLGGTTAIKSLGAFSARNKGWASLGEADRKCIQTGPALSDEPFPPFLIAISPDRAELLPGNKTTRAFLLNPLGTAHLQVVPSQPRRKEANTADASFTRMRPAQDQLSPASPPAWITSLLCTVLYTEWEAGSITPGSQQTCLGTPAGEGW